MTNLDEYRVNQDSRRATTPERYSEALNRYLSASAQPVTRITHRPTGTPPRVRGRIVAAVDDTPAGCTAADHAAVEAEIHGWDLVLYHVQHAGSRRRSAAGDGTRLLERLTDRVHLRSPKVAVTSRLASGSAAPVLLSAARDADLLVVGHRYGAAVTSFGRSLGERVAAGHRGPALVVRMPDLPCGTDFGGRPIVVGVDPRRPDTPAVHFALDEAAARGCDLVVLRAEESATPAGRLAISNGVRVHHRTFAEDPVTALLEYSARASAVVVGRRAPGGLPGRLLGPVSRAMIERAHCPVFLVG